MLHVFNANIYCIVNIQPNKKEKQKNSGMNKNANQIEKEKLKRIDGNRMAAAYQILKIKTAVEDVHIG